MKRVIFAGAAGAMALLTLAVCDAAESTPTTFASGALQVERVGDAGPALIFIPGLASGSWTWRDSADRLAPKYSVYLVTLPGFDGRAAVPGTTFESLNKDLRELIATRHLDRPVLVGHSLGATLALGFAAENSAAIRGVVAVDGLPVFPGTESMTGDRSQLGARARGQLENLDATQFAAYQQTYMKQFGAIEAATAEKIATLSSRSDPRATADFAAQLLELDLRPRLTSIKVPVVAISPFHAPDFAAMGVDESGKANYYRGLLNGIERLEVVSVSPARHFVMFDQPEKFAAALDRALVEMD